MKSVKPKVTFKLQLLSKLQTCMTYAFRECRNIRLKKPGIIKVTDAREKRSVPRPSVGKASATKLTHRADTTPLPFTMPITTPAPEQAPPTLNPLLNVKKSGLIDIRAIQGSMQHSR